MTRAELVDGRIECDVPMRQQGLIKQLPARWHKDTLRWRLPLSWASCLSLRGVFGDALEVGPALAQWAVEEIHDRIKPAMGWRAVAEQMDYPSPEGRLYPYQYTAMQFLVHAGSALLGDEMGLGKTPTAAVALAELNAWPALIVAPKSMGRTWARELATWADVDALVLEGTAPQRAKAFASWFSLVENGTPTALIVSYDILRAHSRLAPYGSISLSAKEKTPGLLNSVTWQAVLCDEAHRIKESKSKQTRAAWAVGDKATHRFALTGTPIANSAGDLWSLLRFVSPDEWPSRSSFLERYCDLAYSHWGGSEVIGLKESTRGELDRIMLPRYLRRTKAEVLRHLPEKVYETRDVEMRPAQAKAYKELAAGMVADLESGQLITFSPLVQGMRLSQIASSAIEVDDDGGVKMIEPSPKLDLLDEILEDLGGQPCAVFAASRQLLDLAIARLEKAGTPYAALLGGQHPLERQEALDRYNGGHVNLILISLGAGAEGVSLTRGSTEVFLDRSWSAIQNKQAEDRLHGTGRGDHSAQHLLIIDLVTRNTIEEHRLSALQNKADALEELVRDRERLLAALRGERA